jgi:hypothetical protein
MTWPNARFIPPTLGAEVIPAWKGEYGQLKGGVVRLKGKMKPAFTRGEGFACQDREGIYDIHERQMREIGMVKYDVPTDLLVGQSKVLICLCLMPRAVRFGDSTELVIVPTGRKNKYRRVGLFPAVKLDWWEGCAEGTISLV